MDENTKKLIALYGAVRAARAALCATSPEGGGFAREFVDRMESIDDDLRTLARDIAQKAGL